MAIRYVTGDATRPEGEGPRVIVHCCNDLGHWGRGFVLALSKRWTLPEEAYREWARLRYAPDKQYNGEVQTSGPFMLSEVQFVEVEKDLWVANLIGQHGIGGRPLPPPIRYEAINRGFKYVRAHAQSVRASVAMPRMGAGLAGGSWDKIADIIELELISHGIAVTVYDLP
jgi:O-acetyl-ADP-ribose deacetylase (regulator of RNase III)